MGRRYVVLFVGWIGMSFVVLGGCAAHHAFPPPPETAGTSRWPYRLQERAHPGRIHHVPTGRRVPFRGMIEVVSSGRVVFVGERHGRAAIHRVQGEVVRRLRRRWEGPMALGMELFPADRQPLLEEWLRSGRSPESFAASPRVPASLRDVFRWYADILKFAREHGIRLVALNAPDDLVEAVRRGPFEDLPPALKRRLPGFGTPDPYQTKRLRSIYQHHVETGRGFDVFHRVHRLWEEYMARRIAETLGEPQSDNTRMVVLSGSFHLRFGFGLPAKVFRRRPVPYHIVLPEPVPRPGEPAALSREQGPDIPLLPGDFVVWVESGS